MKRSFHGHLIPLYTCGGAAWGLEDRELEERKPEEPHRASCNPAASHQVHKLVDSVPIPTPCPFLAHTVSWALVSFIVPSPELTGCFSTGRFLMNKIRVTWARALGARASKLSQKALQAPQVTWGCPTPTCSALPGHEGLDTSCLQHPSQGLACNTVSLSPSPGMWQVLK